MPAVANLAVRITPDAERHVRAGHPWVFDAAVTSVKGADPQAGDLAVVFDRDRKFVAVGLYDPDSPIRIKVLHRGRPRTVDRDFWAERLDAALAVRAPLRAAPDTDAYRLVHGENDGFPGLVLDQYAQVVVAKVYSRAWLPHLPVLTELVTERVAPAAMVLRASRNVRTAFGPTWAEGAALLGTAPDRPVLFREHGLVMEADVITGQKTGYFLDQRDNRARLRTLTAGLDVLDMFCSSGGFTLAAAAGGARSVHSVDLSPAAVATAQRNMAHNEVIPAVAACRHTTTIADAFDVLQELRSAGRRFDVVVIDPPSFAMRASATAGALTAYGRLTELGLGVLGPGGVLVQSSCSSRVSAEQFHATIEAAARRVGVTLATIARTAHAPDHPIAFPEGAYLKTLFARRS